jgi:hypothetical protein
MPEAKNYPFDEIVAAASKLSAAGAQVFQKYTCSGCGSRLTIDEPNKFHTTGSCDKCSAVTDIRKDGCNYMLVAPGGFDIDAVLGSD